MKRLVSILVAATMTLAMAATSFAAPVSGTGAGSETAGSITITNAIPGQDYSIYKLFDLESYSYEGENNENREGQYAYKVVSVWEGFMRTGGGSSYVDVDTQGYVTWKDGMNETTDAEAFGKAALAYAKDNNIEVASETLTAPAAADGEDRSSVSFTGLNLGYYLVDSSAGALCGLTTTNPEINITEKNAGVPEVDKKIDGSKEAASAMIGEKIPYTVTIIAKEGAENYVLHDKMSDGLTFNGDIVVAVGNTTLTLGTDYTVRTGADAGDYTFEVVFAKTYLDTITADTTIVVTYSATLNADAVIEGNNDNTASLSYGDATNETVDSKTTTKTWQFDVLKHVAGDNTKTLAGATFTLSESADGSVPIALVKGEGEAYKVCTLEDHNNAGHVADAHVTEVTTTADGAFKVAGLKAGTYYLTETAAPNGYNKLAAPVEIRIAETANQDGIGVQNVAEGAVVVVGKNEAGGTTYDLAANKQVEVANSAGSLLPSTGGIGTTIFYAAGIILMAGAVFFVVRRKRA